MTPLLGTAASLSKSALESRSLAALLPGGPQPHRRAAAQRLGIVEVRPNGVVTVLDKEKAARLVHAVVLCDVLQELPTRKVRGVS